MYKKPSVSQNFAAAIDHLNDDIETYYDFLDTFGTHYVSGLKMGSKFGFKSKFTNVDIQKIHNENIKITEAAKISAIFFSSSTEIKTEKQKNYVSKFNDLRENYELITIG